MSVNSTFFFEQEISNIIKKELLANKPSLITRFGETELGCIIDMDYHYLLNLHRYFLQKINFRARRMTIISKMENNAGFFSPTTKDLIKYRELIYSCLPQIDILGTWLKREKFLKNKLTQAKKIDLVKLEPYYYKTPWTIALKEKNILIIHPFEKTILHQYHNRRRLLFSNPNVLPEFNLQTIQAVQSIAGNKPQGFGSWFEAFNFLKSEIEKRNFDIAIIGCGAYGMPLAAHVKTMGKKAIHLGGATQLLFGIIGKRWEENYPDFKKRFINEYWVRPFPEDYPKGYEKVENGCYW